MQPTGELVSLAAAAAAVRVVGVNGDRHAGQDGEDQGGVSSSKLMTLRHGIGHGWGGGEREKERSISLSGQSV